MQKLYDKLSPGEKKLFAALGKGEKEIGELGHMYPVLYLYERTILNLFLAQTPPSPATQALWRAYHAWMYDDNIYRNTPEWEKLIQFEE